MSRLKRTANASLSQPKTVYHRKLPLEPSHSIHRGDEDVEHNSAWFTVKKAEDSTGISQTAQSQFSSDSSLEDIQPSPPEQSPAFDDTLPILSMPSPSMSDNFYPFEESNQLSPRNSNGPSPFSSNTIHAGSPRPLALLQGESEMNMALNASQLPRLAPNDTRLMELDLDENLDNDIRDEEFDEEILRLEDNSASNSNNGQSFRMSSPTPSHTSVSSKSSGLTLYVQPQLSPSSAEMLLLRFDQQTCGILSLKDGPTENPWRTLVWPLAQHSPALYHAVASMTAFHGSKDVPELRVSGMSHMTRSIKHLANDISHMSLDAALATSLALAFSEGWDEHISTGIRHLKGAKVMVNNAMVKHRSQLQAGRFDVQDLNRIRFLCNAFVYMDVIARLTSLEEDNEMNFEEILGTVNMPSGDFIEVDPLMGCATTLFPLIGRVANLIQKVRKTENNSLTLVSQANELKQLIIQWRVPNIALFERPEDPHSEVQHAMQTAEAYRLAILLYLHQAVPEIPSEPAAVLAKQILMTLASVPLSSRTTIVQIFPLLAASCEVTMPEDRQWVVERWLALMARLKIGNVDSCFQVVQEVWGRRDQYEAHKTNKMMQRYNSRGMPNGNFATPTFTNGKRKARTVDMFDEQELSDISAEDAFGQNRPLSKRRSTALGMEAPLAGPSHILSLPSIFRRRSSDLGPNNIEPEYTVRGPLHWIRVMSDWNWEGRLSIPYVM